MTSRLGAPAVLNKMAALFLDRSARAVHRVFKVMALSVLLAIYSGCAGGAQPSTHQDWLAPTAQHLSWQPWADVPDARSLALGPNGHVFVGNRRKNKVWVLRDANADGQAEQRQVLLDDLDMPNGIAVLGDDLFVATLRHVWRYPGLAANPQANVEAQAIRQLPSERHHGWRYLAAGPQGWLYLSIGAPCNVCLEPGFARIERFQADGSHVELVADGVRNSVGLAWDDAGRLWFSDNGRDWMGDDQPPCELNLLTKPGTHFGFPFCHGGQVPDPKFNSRPCRQFTAPALALQAHVAPLGLAFLNAGDLGLEGPGLVVAEHGSWNRSTKVGYRLMLATLEQGEVHDYKPLVEGFLHQDRVLGRPVDVLRLSSSSLLVSDDHAGRIWILSQTQSSVQSSDTAAH
nr:sorbosone dehydrogenase family protein [Oceanococcus sp. HetDA_MAG_MS8]